MGFIGSIGNFFSKAFDAVKSFATSGFGKMLIDMAATALGGPLGGVIANAATGLLSGGLNFKNLLQTGLNAFGGLVGANGLGSFVSNLPTALQNPLGLISGVLGGSNGQSIGNLVGGLLQGTSFGNTVNNVLNTVEGFLGKANTIGGQAGGILGQVSGLLGSFGVNTSGLTNFSNGLNSVLGTLNSVNGILQQVSGFLNPGAAQNIMMA
jgi:hypothetical protein